jgi:phosphoserine aminotransferase
MEARNRAKGDVLYGVLDELPDFYRCPVEPASRSVHERGLPPPVGGPRGKFVDEAKAREDGAASRVTVRSAVAARRSTTPCRPRVWTFLAEFMREFAKKNG